MKKRLCTLMALGVAAWPQAAPVKLTGKASLIGRASIYPGANCTATTPPCPTINLASIDPASPTNFAGYADATIRKDPQTGTLWMAYSWPNTTTGATQVVETHVAYSTDRGVTWSNSGLANGGVLFPSQTVTNPSTGATNDHTCSEVMNLYPQVVGGVTYWYGIHQTYLVQQGAGGTGNQPNTVRFALAIAAGGPTTGPMGLATATPQYLGSSQNTDSDFSASVNLTALSGLTNCTQFREPSLIMIGNTMYFQTSCGDLSSIAQFSTVNPQANPGNWVWSYVAKFATQSDAQSVCSHLNGCNQTLYFTQGDIAHSTAAAKTLMILSAVETVAGAKVSLGCVAAELATVSPPTFALDGLGNVKVDAAIASTDSTADGPGSCTYDPASTTGLVMAHKVSNNAPQNGGFFTYFVASGAKP
jgi:hypothetical protein